MTLTAIIAFFTGLMGTEAPVQPEVKPTHSGGVIIVPPRKPKSTKYKTMHSGGVIIVPPRNER